MKTLKKGSKGNEVKQWQQFLLSLEFEPGEADGIFGTKTHNATKKFQQKYELDADGIVGPNTYKVAEQTGFLVFTETKENVSSTDFSNELRDEYLRLFDSCRINSGRENEVNDILSKILSKKSRYESVGNNLGIPWHFIGIIHNMESSLNFKKHLHNGDPLNARTVNVPKGRPKSGNPPFTWEESAIDAMKYKKLNNWTGWSIPGILYNLEKYNGWGYRKYHPEVLSPYLWGFSNHYSSGKYVKDGKWSSTAVSGQCGGAVLLKKLLEQGEAKTSENISEKNEELNKFFLENLRYDDYKNIFEKYLAALDDTQWLLSKKAKWQTDEGSINVIAIRCNEIYITNDIKRNNDWLIVIENRPDDNFRRYIFSCTTDPKYRTTEIANVCEQIYLGNIRNHRLQSNREAICQDNCDVWVRRYINGQWMEEKGKFGINIHNPQGARNSSLGCIILSSDDDYINEFRPLLRRVKRSNIPVAVIRDTKFQEYLANG